MLYRALVILLFVTAVASGTPVIIESFDGDGLPEGLEAHDVSVALVDDAGGRSLSVDFGVADWPSVAFKPLDKAWDWHDYVALAVDVHNPTDEPVTVYMRVDNPGANGIDHCHSASMTLEPDGTGELKTFLQSPVSKQLWGMRGVPEYGPIAQLEIDLDPANITGYQVFLNRPQKPYTLVLDNVRLIPRNPDVENAVPFPFIDRFGQYKHADWPGKLHSEADFAAAIASEQEQLKAMPRLPERDALGGWANGPQLEATGWFRTEKIDGKWWLVTPEGHLFFCIGMDCINTWQKTFVEGRRDWFEWLPEIGPKDAYQHAYEQVSGAHSNAEPVNGEGLAFSFYTANLIRKYGDAYRKPWRDTAKARLLSWGFNTVGAWSHDDVVEESALPFTPVTSVTGDFQRVEGGFGYWAKMPEVYDPDFKKAVERCISQNVPRFADNPLCIGHYVDNELSWNEIRRGVLASPPEQPSRLVFVKWLKDKYGTLDALNAAWGTESEDWDSLRVPSIMNDACTADMDALVYMFSRHYFDMVKAVLTKYAPNQLYLGCRFSGTADASAIRACADVADVVSFNIYKPDIDTEYWRDMARFDKPLLIGEFHFGALDRGMFHEGLVPVSSQRARAESYIRYVRSVADNPAFVGCNWFQYEDEPTTGRWYDGENYNCGFVSIVDTPYPELVAAARSVHRGIYARRAGDTSEVGE